MTHLTRLTDHDIEGFLEARSSEPDPALWSDILAATATARQRRGLWTGWTGRPRLVALLVAGLLLVAVAGAVGVGLGLFRPLPTITPADRDQARVFDRPFSYVLPADSSLELDGASGGIYRFVGVDRGVDVFAVRAGSGSDCRVGGGEGTFTRPFTGISGTPTEVLENMRVIWGVGIGGQSATTLDGRPAVTTDIDPLRQQCGGEAPHIHMEGLPSFSDPLRLDRPGRLTLADVDGLVVGVQIWSERADDLAAWISSATEFVDTIQFSVRADAFDVPFAYAIPRDSGLALTVETETVYRFEAGDRGVDVFVVRDDATTHNCTQGGTSRTNISGTPAEVIESLRAVGGLAIGAASAGTLAGHPALVADRDPSQDGGSCDVAEINLLPGLGAWLPLDQPARLIVADIDGVVVAVQIWTEEQEDLDDWIVTAIGLVESIYVGH